MNTQERIYREAGVLYACADKKDRIPPGMQTFRYYWCNIPTGTNGSHSIQCATRKELRTLIAYWNSKITGWSYSEIPFADTQK